MPTLAAGDDPAAFVDARIAEGADYIKIIHDDGRVLGTKFNTLTPTMIAESVAAARRRGKLSVVHVTTFDAARDALQAKADGLVHIFVDEVPTDEFVERSAIVVEDRPQPRQQSPSARRPPRRRGQPRELAPRQLVPPKPPALGHLVRRPAGRQGPARHWLQKPTPS